MIAINRLSIQVPSEGNSDHQNLGNEAAPVSRIVDGSQGGAELAVAQVPTPMAKQGPPADEELTKSELIIKRCENYIKNSHRENKSSQRAEEPHGKQVSYRTNQPA